MATQGWKFELPGKRHFSVGVFVSLALGVMLMATGVTPSSALADVSIAGVHWYSGDKDMLDGGIPSGERGWNVEAVYGVSDLGARTHALERATIAKNDGLINIIRIDYRSGQAVPLGSGEYDAWADGFIDRVWDFSGVASIFIVGNESTIEPSSGTSAAEYANAFNTLYGRKGEMPEGTKLLAAGPAAFSWDSRGNRNFLDWLEDMSNRLTGVDSFALHTYGDPSIAGCADPRQACSRNGWSFDGGFQSFRQQIDRVVKKWGGTKPIYITEFNTDVNGPGNYPDPSQNYPADWINKAFDAVRQYNANRGSKPSVVALAWFVDRDDSGGGVWASFALRNLSNARADMGEEFRNSANRSGSSPQGPAGSLTGGNVLDESGNLESPVGNTSRTTAAVQPDETRQAEHYWGLRGIDWAGARGESCNAGKVHIAGWHQGDLAEYLVNFPSASQSYTLNVIGLPDDPNPVQVNVYINGNLLGQISWNDGDPCCDEGEGGSSQKIEVRGYQGVYAVAFQFANDWSSTCSPWRDDCDRNFWFDYFKLTRNGETTLLPDVTIEDLWWSPSNPQPGDQVTFNVRVRNGGNAATSQAPGAKEGGVVGVAYFINGNYTSYGLQGAMAAGEVSSSFSMVQPWTGAAGNYQIIALVDDINRFQESNEANNGFTKTLNIGGGSSNPYPNCPCRSDIDNYCLHSPSTPGCPMTDPWGYCDPNGDGSFSDADWNQGYQEFQQYCR
jgi:hypothetical protein